MLRHIDAVELCFKSFLEDIEKTRPRYPDEEPDHWVKHHGSSSASSANASSRPRSRASNGSASSNGSTLKGNQVKVNADAHHNRAGKATNASPKKVRMQEQ